jgi:hypothetical protein
MTYTIPSYSVQPGSVYQPKTNPYILDQIGGVVGCWSTRQLMAAGSGNIIRGRDATTNEADYTSASYPAGIVTLANGGDAFCPALYDQSGNGNHATQTTAANQPKLVDTGSLIVDGSGRPVTSFDGGDTLGFSSLGVVGDLTLSFYAKRDTTATFDTVFDSNISTPKVGFNTGNIFFARFSGGGSHSIDLGALGIDTTALHFYTITRVSGVSQLYVDGVARGATSTSGGAGTFDCIGISVFASQNFNGWLNDLIVFNSALSAAQVVQLYNALAL